MINSNLSEILGRKRIKMSELARKADINKNTVLNLYHDRSTRIEFEVLNKICNILECSPSDILRHTPDTDKGTFGAPIPKMDKAVQIGKDKYIDSDGNKFSLGTIKLNERLGGGYEVVSASMFEDPKGLKDTEPATDSDCKEDFE